MGSVTRDLALREKARQEVGDITFTKSPAWDAWRTPPLTALHGANDNALKVGHQPRIIGLQGFGGVGKSEVRRILERRGYTARHIKQPIADMTEVLLKAVGLTDPASHVDGRRKREPISELGGKSATDIQQFIGTQFGRDFIDPGIWLRIWCRWADEQVERGRGVVQESVRFANEADAIRVRGGLILEVRRPGVGPVNSHVSEALPTTPDVVIDNDGTLDALERQVLAGLGMAV